MRCEHGWMAVTSPGFTCESNAGARELEDELKAKYLPPLTKR